MHAAFRFKYIWILVLLFSCRLSSGQDQRPVYAWPLKATPALTSSFGEYRPGHFHSGIDLKVWGQVGLPCLAVEDGYVSRVKVSSSGYGLALYLKLSDGRTAVYGHLERFAEPVQEQILTVQHSTGLYELDRYFPEETAVHYAKGEVVAYEGRSGTVHPHLHFELRDQFERPLNPLLSGFSKVDTRKPTPNSLAVTPLTGASTVEKDWQPRIYPLIVQQEDGIYRPRDPIGVTGPVALSLKALDCADGSENFLGVYEITMDIEGQRLWRTRFDRFSYDESALIEVERDYRLQQLGWGVYYRLYRAAGNTLAMTEGEGVIDAGGKRREPVNVDIWISDASDNRTKIEVILVSDQYEYPDRGIEGTPALDYRGFYHNSRWRFQVKEMDKFFRIFGPPGFRGFKLNGEWNYVCYSQPVEGGVAAVWAPDLNMDGPLHLEAFDVEGKVKAVDDFILYPAYPDRQNLVSAWEDRVRLNIPAGALYDTTWIRVLSDSLMEVPGWIESVFRVEPLDQPLADNVAVSVAFQAQRVEAGWGLYYFSESRGWRFLSADHDDDYYFGETSAWERFGMVRDVDFPLVREVSPIEGVKFASPKPKFEFLVRDSTSGLDSRRLTLEIDGQLKPAAYDPPVSRLTYQVWKPLAPGEHTLDVKAADRLGNLTVKSYRFKI